MKDAAIKILIPALAAAITAGGFSMQISYERGATQESLGRLVMTMNQACKAP